MPTATYEHNSFTFSFREGSCRLESHTPSPLINGDSGAIPKFGKATRHAAHIAGLHGELLRQEAQVESVRLVREIFHTTNGAVGGIRLICENVGDKALRLNALKPLSVQGDGSIALANATFNDWKVLRMSRHKNDIPGTYRPALINADYYDAQFSSHDVLAGQGVSKEAIKAAAESNRTISSEPCILLRGRENQPGLFIGFLGQTEHLSEISLTTDLALQFQHLEATCEFDGIPLQPGEQRATHWLLLAAFDEENAMLATFANWLAESYSLPPPGPAPSIYCSWYFYGSELTEQDLHENLHALGQNRVPFDVLLIDDCWSDQFGSWNANSKWPSGMKDAADRIRTAGYEPGIWTCPFVVMADSPSIKKYPTIVARNAAGEPCRFGYQGPTCYVVNVTAPEAAAFFNAFYGRLREWGYRYHKMDFLRAVVADPAIRFHQASLTRAQAYRVGMQRVREALGDDAYILACGGLFEGNIGLVDAVRTGTDTRGSWRYEGYRAGRYTTQLTTKQTVFRSYTARLWHVDPDAALIRLRDEPFQKSIPALSLGDYTDEEAFAVLVTQYLNGGIACISERFAKLQATRRLMWRHVLPVGVPPASILDPYHPECPTQFLTPITPRDSSLRPWWNLALYNWEKQPITRQVSLAELPLPPEMASWAVFEFREQRFMGIKTLADTMTVTIPARGVRILRLAAWTGEQPLLLGTNLHVSGGGVELTDIRIDASSLSGRVDTPWETETTVWALFPSANQPLVRQCQVAPQATFRLS